MLPFVTGCGVIFGGTRQTIRATSSPDGATLSTTPPTSDYTTPASINLERKNNYTLTYKKPGYQPAKSEIQKSMRGGILVLDILLFPAGVIVDALTGGWYKLSPEVANVTLTKIAAVPGPDEIRIAISVRPTKEGAEVRVDSTQPGVEIEVQSR
jgi:hypothetical protein